MKLFLEVAKASLVSDYDWSFEELRKELEENLSKIIVTRRAEEIKSIIQSMRKTINTKITDVVFTNFDGSSSEKLWVNLFESYVTVFQSLERMLEKKLKGTNECCMSVSLSLLMHML